MLSTAPKRPGETAISFARHFSRGKRPNVSRSRLPCIRLGHSSLSYLKRFPIDALKIDQSFVQDITRGGSDGAIVSAVIAMGKALNIRVIAEGVETVEQLAFLKEHGCYEFQGLFSRPMAANALTEMIHTASPGAYTHRYARTIQGVGPFEH